MTSLESPLGRGPNRRSLRGVAVAAIVIFVVLAYQFWWSQPTAYGDSNTSEFRPTLRVNQTFSVDMSAGPAEDVLVHSAKPIVVKNTADARVDFVVCRYRTDQKHMGAIEGSMDRYCSSISPLKGYHLRKDRRFDESIYMRVTPRRAGVVHFDGMTVNYSRGWAHLRQTGNEQLHTPVLESNVK